MVWWSIYHRSVIITGTGARPTKHISIEFEIRWKFKTLWCKIYTAIYTQPYFAHVTTVSFSWRVQNIVVTGRVYSKLERSEFSEICLVGRAPGISMTASCWFPIRLRRTKGDYRPQAVFDMDAINKESFITLKEICCSTTGNTCQFVLNWWRLWRKVGYFLLCT